MANSQKAQAILTDPEEILNQYGDMVFRAAFMLTKNKQDAEDAAQEVFIKMISQPPSFESAEHQKAWLLRCVTNRCKSLFRTVWHSRTQGIPEDLQTETAFSKDESGVVKAVNELPLKYRQVVYLYYVEGYSTKEIASILSTTQNTILSRMARGRAMLKNKLGEEFESAK